MSRKVGAQKGNKNALKHGFYSGSFTSIEGSDLSAALSDGLTDEIVMLRVAIRRVWLSFEHQDLDKQTRLLEVLTNSVVRLSHVLRAQKFLTGEMGSQAELISSAIADVLREQGWRE